MVRVVPASHIFKPHGHFVRVFFLLNLLNIFLSFLSLLGVHILLLLLLLLLEILPPHRAILPLPGDGAHGEILGRGDEHISHGITQAGEIFHHFRDEGFRNFVSHLRIHSQESILHVSRKVIEYCEAWSIIGLCGISCEDPEEFEGFLSIEFRNVPRRPFLIPRRPRYKFFGFKCFKEIGYVVDGLHGIRRLVLELRTQWMVLERNPPKVHGIAIHCELNRRQQASDS
mmetsp:Transcript_29959/g.47901  ORF Transcript_29959/g.47901 Transcript_29959/m.47901 type:complete len:228 (-) Transcript_29959:3077-3760(-)